MCGELRPADGLDTGESAPACRYRPLCRGYAPIDSPTVALRDRDGTVLESGTPQEEFLFLMEKLGADEVALGRSLVGKMGSFFDWLVTQQARLSRDSIAATNVIRCRVIAWDTHEACGGKGCADCHEGSIPALNDKGNHIDLTPSFDQVRECSSRYLDDLLARFNGKYIIACGASAVYYMMGRAVEIKKHRGTIFEPGRTKICVRCVGAKQVEGKPRRCKPCRGRGVLKCPNCGGVSKHKKRCELLFPPCDACAVTGFIAGKSKRCPSCHGAGEVAEDPDKPHVCKKLKPHQLLLITYLPAAAQREPAKIRPLIERDFQRITKMEEELAYHQSATYDEYPPIGVGIAADIVAGVSQDLDVRDGAGGAIPSQQPLTIDLETTGLDADSGKITHFAFTDRPGYGCVLRPDDVRVGQLLKRPTLVGQNIVLFDWWWLERHGYKIPADTQIIDTRFLGKLINPDTPNDLPYLTSELAEPPLRGYWKAKDDYRRHIERVACIDVDATTRVIRGARSRLERTGQWQFVLDYIIPISRVVFESRLAGMKVDKGRMEEAQVRIDAALAEKRLELPDWGGTRTEGQHAKVQEYLYETLGLPVQKQRGTWAVTANKESIGTLQGLLGRNDKKVQHLSEEQQAEAVRFLDLLSELRDMSKLAGSFLRYKYSSSSFVHPELNPVGTATLRPTCADPNILQVPGCKCKVVIDGVEVGKPCHGTEKHKCPGERLCWGTNPRCKNARWVFIPDHEDWEIMSVDLSQAEVIGFLWYAEQWDALDQILNKGKDAYQIIANKIFQREASPAERDRTKVDTLAFIYGEGERTQSLRLRISVEEIRTRREVYLQALPGVQDFRDQLIRSAMQRGYIESPWGVRRYIRVESPRGRAANEACNAPIQNICPQITGFAAIKLHQQLPKPARIWPAWLYDELNFVYPKELRGEVYTAVRDILGAPVGKMPARPIGHGMGLRFKLDFAVGDSWGHMVSLDSSLYANTATVDYGAA